MNVWLRQIWAVARQEAPRNLLRGRALPLYLLAALPLLVVALLQLVRLLVSEANEMDTAAGAAMVYALIYQFILRFVVYGGCVWIFMNLIRGEVLDRSLHYYFLTPIRREVLVAGKFVSGWLGASLLFTASTVGSMLLLHAHLGLDGVRHLLVGPGALQLWSYVAVTLLACVGYGAVFLSMGLLLRNMIVPALLFWALEWANPYLPAALKKASVIFYLNSLLPLRIDEGPFALVADPVSPWLAVPGLAAFAALALVGAGWRIRRMEIAYGNE
jgi:ABC-type transport system involved in multi-copper enzyme maturation permease subunit